MSKEELAIECWAKIIEVARSYMDRVPEIRPVVKIGEEGLANAVKRHAEGERLRKLLEDDDGA